MELLIGKTFNYKRTDKPADALRPVETGSDKTESRTVVGICSVFGNVDSGDDIVTPGAFTKAIADFNNGRSRCRFLWNHNSNEPPVAQILKLRVLTKSELPTALRAMPDVTGALEVTRRYFTDPFSDRVYQGVASGALSEMSFGFNPTAYRYENVKGARVRVLEGLELMDASDVQWGMNSVTMATVKGPAILTAQKIAFLKQRKEAFDKVRDMVALSNYNQRRNQSPGLQAVARKVKALQLQAKLLQM